MTRKHAFTSRTKARKRAVDVVFEADQRGMGRNPDILRDLLRERKVVTAAQTPLPEYSVTIIAGVADNLSRIDRLISAHAKDGIDRIAAVDLATMRVATWEILENNADVPAIIAIDEAISIVKSISTDASPAFVNAVLDAIRKDVEAPTWSRGHRIAGEYTDTDEAVDGSEGEESGTDSVAGAAIRAGTQADGESDKAVAGVRTIEELTGADLDNLDELLSDY